MLHGLLQSLIGLDACGYVGRVFHDLERFAIGIQDRIVTCLDPDLGAALADALVLRSVVLTASELFPEHAVFRTLAIARLDKCRMVLAFNLVQLVPKRFQEILIGILNYAVEREFDNGLRLVDGIDHTGIQSLGSDVAPFQHVTDMIALAVEQAIDEQRDLKLSNGDFRADRKTLGVS